MNNTAWKLFLIMITFGIKTVHFMPSNRPFSQTDELTNRVPIQLTDLVSVTTDGFHSEKIHFSRKRICFIEYDIVEN